MADKKDREKADAERALILKLGSEGKTAAQIFTETRLPMGQIQAIFAKHNFAKAVVKIERKVTEELIGQAYKEKLPALKRFVDLGLSLSIKFLEQVDEFPAFYLRSTTDLKNIVDSVKGLNEILEAEKAKDKTTQTTTYSTVVQNQTQLDQLERLKTLDPVFSYEEKKEIDA